MPPRRSSGNCTMPDPEQVDKVYKEALSGEDIDFVEVFGPELGEFMKVVS